MSVTDSPPKKASLTNPLQSYNFFSKNKYDLFKNIAFCCKFIIFAYHRAFPAPKQKRDKSQKTLHFREIFVNLHPINNKYASPC